MGTSGFQNNRSAGRSSYTPHSKRATRTVKAAQSGRIASRGQIGATYSQGYSTNGRKAVKSQNYVSAYTPGSQGSQANKAYARQTENVSGAGQYSRNNPEYHNKRKSGKGKKIAAGVAAALLIVVLGVGTAFGLYTNSLNQELSSGVTETEQLQINEALAPVATVSEPFYMLLLGSDARKGEPTEGTRSDTNILLYVDPKNNNITMLSIPRDTLIELEGYGTNKFNAAYAYEGRAGAIREASKLCGVDISYYAEISFDGLEDLVDAIGGIEVDVPMAVNDYKAGDAYIEEGLQKLNGQEALTFARTRQFIDGDFTRTSNQRLVVEAIIKRVMELPVTDLPNVIQEAAKCVYTNFEVNDLITLATQFQDIRNLTLYSAMIPSEFLDINGISYATTDTEALKEMIRVIEEGGDPSTVDTDYYTKSIYDEDEDVEPPAVLDQGEAWSSEDFTDETYTEGY